MSEAAGVPETPWETLHPSSLLINLGPRIWSALKGFWWLIVFAVFGGGSWGDLVGVVIGLTLVAGLGAASAIIHVLTLRYRVHAGRLEIRQGLINKRARVIDPGRIQNAELVRNVVHKAFGLVEVRLETAGGARTEGLLSALTEDAAAALLTELDRLRGREDAGAQAHDVEVVLAVGLPELVAYGLTSRTVGTVAILAGLFAQALELMEPEEAVERAAGLGTGVVVAVLLLAFVLSFGVSVSMALARHWRYTLSRTRVELQAESGLLTRRKARIPLEKVQLAAADEPLLRRWLGYGSLAIETAGLGTLKDESQAAEASVPMVPREDLGRLVGIAIPVAGIDPWNSRLDRAHPRALLRALYGSTSQILALVALCVVLAGPWGWLSMVLMPLAWLASWLDHRSQGWRVTEDIVLARRGFWRRRTSLLPRDKIQSVHLVQGPLMRRHGLGRLLVRVAGTQVALPDIAHAQAQALMEALRPRVGLPATDGLATP